MDPLTALSVAGNVAQFTAFAFTLIHGTTAIYQSASGASSDSQHLDAIYSRLSDFNSHIQAWLFPGPTELEGGHISKHSPKLIEITRICKEDCDKLLAILTRLRVQSGSKGRIWRSFQKAMLEVWKLDDINSLKDRIRDSQRMMTLQLCAISSENVEVATAQLRAIEDNVHSLHAQRKELSDDLTIALMDIRDSVNKIKAKIDYMDPNDHARLHAAKRGLKGPDRMLSQRLPIDNSLLVESSLNDWQKLESNGLVEEIEIQPRKSSESRPLNPEELEVLTTKVSRLSLKGRRFMKEEAFLSSLDFEKRPVRHDSIPNAHKRTFEWIFSGSTSKTVADSSFATWLKSGNGAFWITGKPGSGKSTLMKLIADRLRPRPQKGLLSEWAQPKRVVVASHYFWSAGSSTQRSQEGLLRSLLFDIFAQAPELIPEINPKRWEQATDSQPSQKPWTQSELWDTLRKLAKYKQSPAKFCLLIDGLDEFEGDKDLICRNMLELETSENIKLCISSRPWNIFEDYFGSGAASKISIHDLTKDDIRTYIKDRLYEHPRWKHASAIDDKRATQLIDEITNRADGVFLWVFLVTKMLREGLTNDDSMVDLWKRLESIPTDLEQFFKHILESVEPFYHEKMAGTLQIALAGGSPLPLEIYYFHDL